MEPVLLRCFVGFPQGAPRGCRQRGKREGTGAGSTGEREREKKIEPAEAVRTTVQDRLFQVEEVNQPAAAELESI